MKELAATAVLCALAGVATFVAMGAFTGTPVAPVAGASGGEGAPDAPKLTGVAVDGQEVQVVAAPSAPLEHEGSPAAPVERLAAPAAGEAGYYTPNEETFLAWYVDVCGARLEHARNAWREQSVRQDWKTLQWARAHKARIARANESTPEIERQLRVINSSVDGPASRLWLAVGFAPPDE